MLDLRPAVGSMSTFIWETHWRLEVTSGVMMGAMLFTRRMMGKEDEKEKKWECDRERGAKNKWPSSVVIRFFFCHTQRISTNHIWNTELIRQIDLLHVCHLRTHLHMHKGYSKPCHLVPWCSGISASLVISPNTLSQKMVTYGRSRATRGIMGKLSKHQMSKLGAEGIHI